MIILLIRGLLALGAVAFVTLLERKVLGLRHIRLGPNKVTWRGLLQPVADGIKLLFKQLMGPSSRQILLYFFVPLFIFRLFLRVWVGIVPWYGLLNTKYTSLLFFVVLGLGRYVVIIVGWRATRAFAKLGSIRGILQGLSFEVALVLVFILALVLFKSFKLGSTTPLRGELMLLWGSLWVILSLIESNRAPFDLLEGERELIRGFNLEMGSSLFVFLFLREYGIIIVMRGIMRIIMYSSFVWLPLFSRLLLLVRSCYPRVRYDSIIGLIWQRVLPLGALMFLLYYYFY